MKTTFFSDADSYKGDMLVYFCSGSPDAPEALVEQYRTRYTSLSTLTATKDFTGTFATSFKLYSEQKNCPRILVVGYGDAEKLTLEKLRKLGAHIAKTATGMKLKSVGIVLPSAFTSIATTSTYHSIGKHDSAIANPAQAGAAIIEGIRLAAYKYMEYFSDKSKAGNTLQSISFVLENESFASHKKALQAESDYANAVCDAVLIARGLALAPNNDLYPEKLAEQAQTLGKEHGIKVTVFNKAKITSQKMYGLLAVNQGSVRPPVFIIMEHRGGKSNEAPIVLVGKGVTFDTGGISIKPSAGMAEMKMDMHGAATMIATMVSVLPKICQAVQHKYPAILSPTRMVKRWK
jgi:leucyl aminopeptidase